MIEPFRTTRRVEFGDTDMAGIVHFSNFFRYMEAAETAFWRSLGLSVSFELEGERFGLPRVSAACEYMKPARFEEVLDVAVIVEKVGRKSVTFRYEFSRESEPIATGRVTCVFCRKEGMQMESVEIPAKIRERLGAEAPES